MEKYLKVDDMLHAFVFNQIVTFLRRDNRVAELKKLFFESNFPSNYIQPGMSKEEGYVVARTYLFVTAFILFHPLSKTIMSLKLNLCTKIVQMWHYS